MEPSNVTIVIKHPVTVTKEYLLGVDPGFANNGSFLDVSVVRRAIHALIGRHVKTYDDGLYHATIHTFGMMDLLNAVSAHDAMTTVQRIPTKPDSGKKIYIHAGIRWEVSDQPRELRIFGPRSDPDNQIVIDLREAV